MRASSASGRGNPRTVRRPAKVIRIPTATVVRRRQRVRAAAAIGLTLFVSTILLRFVRFTVPPTQVATPPVRLSAIEARVVELINAERALVAAEPLTLSAQLTLVARAHAHDMADNGYLAHETAGGDTPVDRVAAAGLEYDELAENLLSDSSHDHETLPQRALAAWMASPVPRHNLLSPRFRTVAIAIAHAVNGSAYITLDLMR